MINANISQGQSDRQKIPKGKVIDTKISQGQSDRLKNFPRAKWSTQKISKGKVIDANISQGQSDRHKKISKGKVKNTQISQGKSNRQGRTLFNIAGNIASNIVDYPAILLAKLLIPKKGHNVVWKCHPSELSYSFFILLHHLS